MPAYGGMWTLSQVAQAIKNLDWTGVPPTVVEYLIVAGGGSGAGGWDRGGGGGAGGLLQGYAGITIGNSYYVTVGAGGAGVAQASSGQSNAGTNSVFDSTSSGASTGRIVAIGGAGGGTGITGPATGGSGGGGFGGAAINTGGAGISGQGNAGGSGVSSSQYGSGGGGGAGTIGLTGSTTNAGNGGAGIASDITGTRVTYAGGGGGGINSGTAGSGGIGGGGTGAATGAAPTDGLANTGGGGGGCGGSGSSGAYSGKGAGGSGIVVIRYPGNVQYFTGGTLNYSNGFIVHTFYSSGTLAPTTPRLFASPDYQISRSLRFNGSTANLTRTLTTATTRNRWTWSGWVKRSSLDSGGFQTLFGSSDGAIGNDFFGFNQATFRLGMYGGTYILQSTAQYRDPAAWYHVVVAVDTTQSTDTDRAKVYINGVQITAWGTAGYPPQNYSCSINGVYAHQIGSVLSSSYSSMMLTEVNFIDGQALLPTSFGYIEPSTGVWTPLQYTGSYGTNGFYLNFADNSGVTAATLGKDLSGNGNNWTPNNFSVAAGSGNSSLVDSPTNYGTDTGVGGEVRGNYCTWNPVSKDSGLTLSNGNLDYSSSTNADDAFATMGLVSGKWYFEFTPTLIPTLVQIGVATNQNLVSDGWLSNSVSYRSDGQKYVNGTASAYGATFVANDVIGIAVDIDNNLITFYKNNVSQGAISYTFTGLTAFPVFRLGNTGGTGISNFGQRPFAYTAPTGFKALCTQNLPESGAGKLPGNYFGVATYTGTGSLRSAYVGFRPDMVWIKSRSSAYNGGITDSVRGTGRGLYTNNTDAEANAATYFVNSFTYDGFTIQDGVASNASGTTYVAWAWNAGGTTVTNTTGSISAQVRANPTAGFSIVTYTGTSANATIGHGLGVAPRMIIVKRRDAADIWTTYHESIGNTQYLRLQDTNQAGTYNIWQNTSPTSSVFYISTDTTVNTSTGTYVAYCWAEVAGYSKFGSYTGNGSTDGPFVYCGFRPRYVMWKQTNATGEYWEIIDSTRGTYNVNAPVLYANVSSAEESASRADFLSNGFKLRQTNAGSNASGSTYIYMAFAESPLKYARAR